MVKYICPENPNNAAHEIEELLGEPINPVIQPTSIFSMMSPRDVLYALQSGHINFGAHTVTHPILSALDNVQLAKEIKTSVDDVEILTGTPCKLFAYPNGRSVDFDNRAIKILKSKKVFYSFTTINKINYSNTNPHELFRWTVGSNTSLLKFRAYFLQKRVSEVAREYWPLGISGFST
jgi:hypothetical protein